MAKKRVAPKTPVELPSEDDITPQHVHEMQRQWCWFLTLGAGLMLLGTVTAFHAILATQVAVVLLGVLLMAGGIAQIVTAFQAAKSPSFLMHLLMGILYTIAGLLIADTPDAGAAVLTLLMAVFFIVSGTFRIAGAMSLKFENWGWSVFSGVLSVLLGMLIYKQWPESSLLVIGLFVGIEMFSSGLWWVSLGCLLRRACQEEEDAEEA